MLKIFVIIVLFITCCVLATKLFHLNFRIDSISKQLNDIENNIIITQFNGDELENIVKKINIIIDNNRQAKIKMGKEQKAMKQAITDICHDIRTPLTSVVGYLQLAERSAESAIQHENISIALERARYCGSLVNDFFELSVLESTGCEPVMEKVDVNDMLCELILANYPNFEERKITPYFEDSGKPIYVLADKKMLTRVIQNLISNGIKYGNEKLKFKLSVDDMVEIAISNPIMETELDVDRVFEKFYRANKSRKSNGAGIGLYICKQFVEAMGGNISATLENKNFIVILKLGSRMY